MSFFRRQFSRMTDNTRPGGDNRSGIPPSQRPSFDAARHPAVPPPEVGPPQEPLAQTQQYLSGLAAHAFPPAEGSPQGRIQSEIDNAITVLSDNTRIVTEALNQGDRSLPRNPEQLRGEYKQVKQEIRDTWPRMLATQTPTASYHRTLEFKQLRNRKSEFRTDPNKYIDKLRALQGRMSDPVTAIHDEIEVQHEIEVQPFKTSNLVQMEWYKHFYHPKVLSKLKNLPDTGLGNENESKQDLINEYKIIVNKFNKTVLKLHFGIIPFAITMMTSEIFMGKKNNGLLRSADFYHNWIRNIDRQIDAVQTRNQGQTGTQGTS